MQEVLDRGVEIDRCHEGHGIYFDRGEVERFVGADPGLDSRLLAAANRQATRSDVACCGCARPMLVFQSALVAAHLCQYCGGTWIDGGVPVKGRITHDDCGGEGYLAICFASGGEPVDACEALVACAE